MNDISILVRILFVFLNYKPVIDIFQPTFIINDYYLWTKKIRFR